MTAADPGLVERFNTRMAVLYEAARQNAAFLAVRNQPTLGPGDGFPLAQTILGNTNTTEAFNELVASGCEALTVEFLVLQHPYSQLFSVRELNVARRRLGQPMEDAETPEAELAARFEERMRGIYDTAKRDLHYDARHFARLIEAHGGVGAARVILDTPELAGGLGELAAAGRADLRVAALVSDGTFASLFTAEEMAVARSRPASL